MKKSILTALIVAACCGRALAVTVDFEAAPIGPLTNFYAGSGVTFSNTTVGNFGSLAGQSGVQTIFSTSGSTVFGVADAVVATFSSAQTAVSITGVDLGAAGVRIDAYDAAIGGNLIDFDQAFGTGVGVGNFAQVSTGSASIWRVEIYQPSPDGADGLVLDDLTFSSQGQGVPDGSATLSLLAASLVGMLVIRRRMR